MHGDTCYSHGVQKLLFWITNWHIDHQLVTKLWFVWVADVDWYFKINIKDENNSRIFYQKKKKNNSRIWFDISMIAKKKKEKR